MIADTIAAIGLSSPRVRFGLFYEHQLPRAPGQPDEATLLANARVHTPAGTTVTTRIEIGSDRVELTVADDGPGIEAGLLPHLFERFVRADKSRSSETGSFGLGLSIAASIIEAHRGSIDVESADGQTTFRVTLPMVRVGAQHATST